MKSDIEQYLDSVGEIGSMERLKAISVLGLGERSEAAKRVIDRREIRKYYMQRGLTFEQANIIVKSEYDKLI